MGVMKKVLAPGVQDAEESDFRSEMFRIARDGEQCLRRGAEEDAINGLFVVKGKTSDLVRNCEDDMEVFDRQQFSPPAIQPFCPLRVLTFGAMAVTAGVVGNTRVIALAAFFGMASEHGGAAHLNGAHDAQLRKGQAARFSVKLAVLSENAGQFESRPCHGYFLLGCALALLRGFVLLPGLACCSSRSSGLTVAATT